MFLTILVFLLLLSVLVLIHEAGHFFVAKKFGIKVEEFGFGFPPRLFGKKIGETIYSINWLPIGGFVKLYGEDEAGGGKVSSKKLEVRSSDRDRAFFAKSAAQRAIVIVAGVVMNVVLAAVIFYVFLGISGFKTDLPLLSDYKFFGVNQTNITEVVISAVVKNSPAEKQGLKPMTKVVSVNGKKIIDSKDFINVVNGNRGKEIEITWSGLQTQDIHKTKIIPRLSPPAQEGALGVGLFSMSTAVLNYETPTQKIFSGIVHPINLMSYNLNVMARLVKVSLEKKTTEPLTQGVSGPVGIASITGSILEIQNLKEKILGLLNLAGILSISLAFFNILPIPALDGGRLFFILIEAATGKKVNQRFEAMTHTIGMIVLLGLMVLITFKDITKLFIK
ncbi:MAG: site-2 protease family protein [Candidatus Levybacteria bacterium]|nr:site-2 protease family protein [Candidatus Levybacteria bacterium]MDZ4228035.1 site-2 protease family protein [Candidatus Levybacteria bacterium]